MVQIFYALICSNYVQSISKMKIVKKCQNTSSDIKVAMARPTSWYRPGVPGGPNIKKINRVGTGTSVIFPRTQAFSRRTNAVTGFFKKSSSPTRTFDACAPGGIFFIKLLSYCRIKNISFVSITLNTVTHCLMKVQTSE